MPKRIKILYLNPYLVSIPWPLSRRVFFHHVFYIKKHQYISKKKIIIAKSWGVSTFGNKDFFFWSGGKMTYGGGGQHLNNFFVLFLYIISQHPKTYPKTCKCVYMLLWMYFSDFWVFIFFFTRNTSNEVGKNSQK